MTEPEAFSFNVIALGPKGSGKTVYLATLHNMISSGTIENGISITTDLSSRIWLTDVYRQVADASKPWPESTPVSTFREVSFRCTVDRPGHATFFRHQPRYFTCNVFNLNYIDYAGELATDWNEEQYAQGQTQLERKLDEAQVIIGIIDGEDLLRYMADPDANRAFLDYQVRPVVTEMWSHPVPVHFVITKWDVLLPDFSFAEVMQALLDSPGTRFGELVEKRTSRRGSAARGDGRTGRVRVIPVSSVGEFASLDADGTVRKVPGQRPAPLNVEIPLVAAIIDVCDAEPRIRGAHERRARRAASLARKRARESSPIEGDIAAFQVKVPARLVVAAFQRVTYSTRDQSVRAFRAGRRKVRKARARNLDHVSSGEGAVKYVAHAFGERLKKFEAQFRAEQEREPANAEAPAASQLISSQEASEPD